jgi:transposase InsO family protein
MAELTELPAYRILNWAGLPKAKYHDWVGRYGKANEHNAWVPRDHWLTEDEKRAILDYHERHPLEGYRRLTFMMLDEDVVAVSPASVYRVLHAHHRLDRWSRTPSKKGTGFVQPTEPHRHWHIDIAYINVAGTFFFLCSILDGCSRYIVHWEIRETMTEADVELIVERARERFPGEHPRIISDNGPQFIAKDFKDYVRLVGLTHVRISPGYPQSNGKIERWHKTLKADAIRVRPPSSLDEARRIVEVFVEHYNLRRLHSAIGYITPADRLAGRQDEIWAERDRRLQEARERRRLVRQAGRAQAQLEAVPC